MPTGYTQLLIDNPSMPFKNWALLCARAFGACIMMRDDDMSIPAPKKVKPDTSYHKRALREAQATIRKLKQMTETQKQAYNTKKTAETLKYNKDKLAAELEEQRKFDSMKARVLAWNPPADYANLKVFMLKQLDMSTTHITYYENELAGSSTTDWWQQDLNSAEGSIKYHTEGITKEIKSANERTAWLQGLYKSLPKK